MTWLRAVLSVVTAAAVALVGSTTTRAAPTGPSRPVLYVVGDSWSAGLHADPAHTLAQDAAAELAMTPVVDAESGTGYVHAPPGTRSYPQRTAGLAIDDRVGLVVVQGGSNDDGSDPVVLADAITRTVGSLEVAFPHAQLVLLGPGPDPWPISNRQSAVDDVLRRQADLLHLPYISPMREQWFTASTIDTIIDPRTDHPTVHGHAVLGHLLARDLVALHAPLPSARHR